MASEVLRIRIRADSGNTAAVFNDISRNILGMTVGAAGARSGMMGLGAALSGAQITGRLAAAMFGAAAYGVYSMGSAMIQAAGAQDQFRVSMTALLKDTSKVDAVTAAVKRFADATSFSNEAVFQVAQNLVAAKVPLQNLIPTLQMLGDVSLGNAEKFSGIATAWYQIIAKGKLTAEEINQIAERGVSVWAILAEETGKSVPELQKLAETGKLTVDAYMPILQRGLAKNYAGSLKEASNLSTNLLVNISKSITNFAAAIGSGLGDTVNPFLQFLAQAFQRAALYAKALTQSAIWARFTQSLQAAAEALAPIIKGIGIAGFIGLIRVVQILTPAMYFLAAAFRGISSAASQAMQFLKPLTDTFSRIATRIKQLDWQGLWTSIKSQSSDIGAKIGTLLYETLAIAWDEFRKKVLPVLRGMAKDVVDGIVKAVIEHPVETLGLAFAGWVLLGMQGVPAALAGKINWLTIIGAMIVAADIQTGLETQDYGLFAQGVAEGIALAFGTYAFGPVVGVVGAIVVGVVAQDMRKAFEEKDWTAFWTDIAGLILGAFAAVAWGPMAGIAVASVAPTILEYLLLQLKDELAKGDYSGIWEISFGLLFGAFALVFTPAAFAGVIAVAAMVFARRLYLGIKGAFTGEGVDWTQLSSLALGLIGGALLLGVAGVPAIVAVGLGAAIAFFGPMIIEKLRSLNWTEIGMYIVKRFQEAFETVKNIDWVKVFTLLKQSLTAVVFPLTLLYAVGEEIIVGMWNGMKTKAQQLWTDFKAWINSFIVDTKKELEVASPSKIFEEIGGYLIDGLYLGIKNGLTNGWTSLVTGFQKWVDDIGIWFEDWKTKVFTVSMYALFSAQTLIDSIGTGFQHTWDMAKLAVQGTLDGLVEWFRSWATGEGGFATKLLEFFSHPDSMTKGIEAMWNGAKNLVASTLDSIIEYFRSWSTGDFAKKLQDFFGADVISNAIKNGLKAAWEGAKGVLDGLITDAKKAVSSTFSGMTGGSSGSGGGGGQTRDQAFWAERGSTNNAGKTDAQINKELDARGFAMGGSFRVGGSGGTDSQLVQFRASPNETVTIRRPDQGGGGMVIQNLNVYADSYQGGQDAARAIRDALGGQRKMLFATT